MNNFENETNESIGEFYDFLTKEQIEDIKDMCQGHEMLCKRNLFLDCVDNLDDMKEILRLKYHSLTETENNSDCRDLYETYPYVMKQICELLHKMETYVEQPDFQREIGEMYKISKSVTSCQIEELKKRMKIKNLIIMVTGETKAGKSTFTNLLLGKQLLPMNPIKTYQITNEIQNSNERIVTFTSPNKPDIVKNLPILLDKTIAHFVENEIEKDYNNAIFKYPVNLLPSYISLVESQVVDDSSLWKSISFESLNNRTPIFIFVLNAVYSNGLGLNTKRFIKNAKEELKNHLDMNLTNPNQVKDYYNQYSNAIFIVNHWDTILGNEKCEKEIRSFKDLIIKEIKYLWHELMDENEQIVFLSARQANDWQKFGIVKREIINIRKYIRQLFADFYQKNLEDSFQLLDVILTNLERIFLQKFNAILDNRYCRLYDQRHAEHLCDMLGNLIKEMDNRKSKIREQLKPKFETMAILLTEHLKSADVENRILDQSKTLITATDNMDLLTVAFRKILETRLYDEILQWQDKNKPMEQLYNFLSDLFEENISQISDEIIISNALINKESLIKAWNSTRESAITNFDKHDITKIEKFFIILTITLLFPVVVLAGLLAIPLIMRHILKEKKTNEEKLALYKKNPEVYLQNMISQSLQKLTVNDVRKGFFNNVQRKCEDHMKAFDNFITIEINEKRQLVMEIENENREIPEILNSLSKLYYKIENFYGKYHKLKNSCENARDIGLIVRSTIYNKLFDDNFKLAIQMDVIINGKFNEIFKNSHYPSIVFKRYKKKFCGANARYQMQEIDILNKAPSDYVLRCKNIFFLGDQKDVFVVLEEVDCSLHQYLVETKYINPTKYVKNSSMWNESCKFIVNVSFQICKGLEFLYLHDPRMVHPDLRIETILVRKGDFDDKVQIFICDACVPCQICHLDETDSPIEIVDYLEENIYSLGLIFYNLAYFECDKIMPTKQLFFSGGKLCLAEIDSLNVECEKYSNTPIKYHEMINSCLSDKPETLPNIEQLISILHNIKLGQ